MNVWNHFNEESLEKHYQIFWIEHYLPVVIRLYFVICFIIVVFIFTELSPDISEAHALLRMSSSDPRKYNYLTQTNAYTYRLVTKYLCYFLGLVGGQIVVADFYFDPFQFQCFGLLKTKTTYEVTPPKSSHGTLRGGRLKYYYKPIIIFLSAIVLTLKMVSNYFSWEEKHYEHLWESQSIMDNLMNVSSSSNFSASVNTTYLEAEADVS